MHAFFEIYLHYLTCTGCRLLVLISSGSLLLRIFLCEFSLLLSLDLGIDLSTPRWLVSMCLGKRSRVFLDQLVVCRGFTRGACVVVLGFGSVQAVAYAAFIF